MIYDNHTENHPAQSVPNGIFALILGRNYMSNSSQEISLNLIQIVKLQISFLTRSLIQEQRDDQKPQGMPGVLAAAVRSSDILLKIRNTPPVLLVSEFLLHFSSHSLLQDTNYTNKYGNSESTDETITVWRPSKTANKSALKVGNVSKISSYLTTPLTKIMLPVISNDGSYVSSHSLLL